MKRGALFLTLLVVPLITVPAQAQDFKFSGYMFGDYYWVAANHNKAIEDMHGFWFRRIYFTFDQKLSTEFSVRLRFEMNSPGDFKSALKLEPFVKDAYLRWKKGQHSVILGLSPTPTWDVIEKIWGYRSVEKTPLDLQKFGSSRDLGLALKGSLDAQNKVRYHLMFANGAGTKSETNPGKKVLFSLGFYPTEALVIEFYADYEARPQDTDRYTVQGFAAWRGKRGRIGVHYAHQTRKVPGGDDLQLDLASVFAVVKLSDKASLLARYDRMFDPNPNGAKIAYIPFDPTAKSNFLVVGLDLLPHAQVHLIPNVEFVWYSERPDGTRPDSDVIPRITFYYRF